jgi:hypothetical protein
MARPAFKRWWTRFVPVAAGFAAHTLLSSVALILLFVFWQPMGGVIWNVEVTGGAGAALRIVRLQFGLVLLSRS